MLARLVSETWKQPNKEEIFIDRDGLQFRYILNYMRTQNVNLPACISKASFQEDLQYYGFEDVPDDAIAGSINYDAATRVVACKQIYQKKLERIGIAIEDLQRQRDFTEIAFACFNVYVRDGKHELKVCDILVQSQFKSYFRACHGVTGIRLPLAGDKLDCFQECLAPYGLRYVSHSSSELKVEALSSEAVADS